MGQRTTQGYLFILNMLFRPFLMTVGFVLMVILVQVVGGFFLYMFPMAVASMQVDSITGVFTLCGLIAVYASGCLAIVNIGSNMIYMVPNNVLSWIGGTMINNVGQGMEQHTAGVGSFGGTSGAAADSIRGELKRRAKIREAGGVGGGEPGKTGVET